MQDSQVATHEENWTSHVVPLLVALAALAMVVLTPFWAVRCYRQPFLGILLEPSNVVSRIGGSDWPALEAGVQWPDRLMAINNLPVGNVGDINRFLSQNGFEPVSILFNRYADGQSLTGQLTVQITPVRMRAGDLLSLFIIPYGVGVIFLATGLWAYRLRGGLRASRAFLAFTASVSILATTFFDMNTTHHVVLLWSLSLFIAAGALGHLSLVFPQQMPFVDRWPLTRFIPWVLAFTLCIPAVREMIAPTGALNYIGTWQTGYFVMAAAILAFLATLVVRIFHGRSAVIRQQSRVIVFGATLAFAPIMIFYLLPTALSSQPPEFRASIYFPLLILLPLTVTYAILRYRLLDVDRVLSRVLTYMLTMAAALVFFYALVALVSYAIQKTIAPNNPLLIAGYLLLLVVGLNPLRDLIQKLIDRLFYRVPADYRRVLNELSRRLVISPDLERTLGLLAEQLEQAFSPEEFAIYLYDDDQAVYVSHSKDKTNPAVSSDEPLVRLLRTSTGAIWYPSGRTLPPELEGSAAYRQMGCSVFVPLRYEGSLIGFMALGDRRSGEPYTSEDLDFLGTVAGQSTLALENARLFVNLRRTYEQTLEMKNLMDDIFASIATGVITTDVEHKITLFNQAAEQILGIPVKDVIGKSLVDALPYLCPDLDEVTTEALERGAVTLSREVTPNIPPRGDLHLRISCSPLHDAYLGTKGVTIVFEDLTQQRELEADRERIRQTFGRVVAPSIRDRLLSDPSHLRLDGARNKVTIMFADISGFTHFSEITEPETIFKMLNTYLSLAAQAVLEEEGTLDKFMGDAVLALWNTPNPQPDHALRAVRAAMLILERSRQAHSRFKDPLLHLQFRIGVTTGDAMVGNVGTSELFNYTAIGDPVNIAQRLQAVAQAGQVLIDQSTYEIVASHARVVPLEPVQVKGKAQPVVVYELKGLR